MYVKNVSATGFKSGDFSVALTRANVIVGDNFAGKTRVMDAIRLGLLGYLPELGNTNKATFGLCNGGRLSVTLTFDNGAVALREWWVEGNSIKSQHTLPGAIESSPLLGVMLNAEEYFAKGPTDRVRYVFANCAVPALFRAELTERIMRAAPGYDMLPHWEALDEKAQVDQKVPTPQEELEFLLVRLREEFNGAKIEADTQQKTIHGITAQRADEGPGVSLSALEDERASLERKLTEANERKARLMGSYMQMKTDHARRQVIARELQAGEKTRESITTAQTKLSLLQEKLASSPVMAPDELDKAIARTAAATPAHTSALMATKEASRARIEAEKALASLDGQTECPYCHACGDNWKNAIAAEYAQKIDALKITQEKAEKAELAAVQETRAAQTELERLRRIKATLDELARTITETQNTIRNLEPQVSRMEALAEERGRLMEFDPALETAVQAVQTEINMIAQSQRENNTAITQTAGRAGDLVRLANAEKARDEAIKRKDLAAVVGKELGAIQKEMVENAFGPLLETANRIFGGALLSPLAFRDGEIGTRRGGVWVGHRTMSGVEKLLTYCAIQMALTAKAPVRVALLDEMGRLVAGRVPGVALLIQNAIRNGDIDQAVVIDPERPSLYVLPAANEELAFQVVDLGE